MITVVPICIQTNYAYILHKVGSTNCLIVDPTSSEPILSYLEQNNLTPLGVICLHRHPDHISGVFDLSEDFPEMTIFCPLLNFCDRPVTVLQDLQEFFVADIHCKLIHSPGHTRESSLLFCTDETQDLLFTSDTLFHMGCGRLFESKDDPSIMYSSLNKILRFPPDTLLFFGHDYSVKNIYFTLSVDDSDEVKQHLRTLPTSMEERCCFPLSLEKRLNPFLRIVSDSEFRDCVLDKKDADPVEAFTKLRSLRDCH
ncbi:hypothetical protein RCL1_005174 [Eukaryota sp. TZLM3-RCL]